MECPAGRLTKGKYIMKKLVLLILSFLIVPVNYLSAFSGGNGTTSDPYQIANMTDFLEFVGAASNSTYVLTANIDFAGTVYTGALIAAFDGTFDGAGHKISNLTINSDDDNIGLFGVLNSGAIVSDLTIDNVTISATGKYVGGLCGRNNGTMQSCSVSGTVTGLALANDNPYDDPAYNIMFPVGGLCGWNNYMIVSCHSAGQVSGVNCVGGLAGISNNGRMESSYSTADVIGLNYIGGLTGYFNNFSYPVNCFASGSVTGNFNVGGLCGGGGDLNATLVSCFASGKVTGISRVGGLCGQYSGVVMNCYATGAVSGSSLVGALVGYNSSGSVRLSYATGRVVCNDNTGGFISGLSIPNRCLFDKETTGISWSDENNSFQLKGLTTAQMQTLSTFTDELWDFDPADGDVADWQYTIGQYPYLSWETRVEVPSVTGLTLSEAMSQLNAAGIQVNVVYFDSDMPAELVAAQDYSGFVNVLTPVKLNVSTGIIKYSGGAGSPVSPYIISSVADLLALGQRPSDYDKCFQLTRDLDLAGQVFAQAVIAPDKVSENSYYDGRYFSGRFDGNGHAIRKFTVSGSSCCALFGSVGATGVIEDLNLSDVIIVATGNYSGVISSCNNGIISNCQVAGSITGFDYVGGLGGDSYGSILDSVFAGSVNGVNYVGGLCGRSTGIARCSASGTVTATKDYVGGLCGYGYGNIISSYSKASVKGRLYVGGFCGQYQPEWQVYELSSKIIDSYATGSVSGHTYVGGCCGSFCQGYIMRCYSSGLVLASSNKGGFIGSYQDGTLSRCFWDVQTSGLANGLGSGISERVIGKTTAELQILATFTASDWDFSATDGDVADWQMREGFSYPHLAWEVAPAGDIAGGWGVDIGDLEALAGDWLGIGISDINADGMTDMLDFAVMAKNWLVMN